MRILLARHGQTSFNAQNRFQGIRDIPLNEVGLRQAQLLAPLMASYHPQKIYTSDLTRSITTAQPAADLLGITPCAEAVFREFSWGVLEGLTWLEAHERYPELFGRERKNLRELQVPGQETADLFRRRIRAGLELLLNNDGLTAIALVGHGHYLNGLIVEFLGLDYHGPWPFSFASASVTVLEARNGRRRLLCFNEECHLKE